MHETSVMTNLMTQIESLAKEHKAKRVSRIKVKLGALSHFSKDHFRDHFDIASKDTIAMGAHLDIELLSDEKDPHAQDIILEEIDVDDDGMP